MPKIDLDSWRGQWQSAKSVASDDPNQKIRDLLKTFDKGLGPALDKIMEAGRAGNAAQVQKRADAALKIIQGYTAKIAAIPRAEWKNSTYLSVNGALGYIEKAVTEQRKRAADVLKKATK